MEARLRTFVLTSLAHFTNDGTALLYPVLMIYYVTIPGIQYPELGGMAVVYYLVSGTLSTPIGRYADKTGKYGVLLSVGLAILGVAALIWSLPFLFPPYTIPLIFTGAFVLGTGQAFYHPLGAAILRNVFNRGGAPRAMGFNGSFGSLGRAIFPSVVGYIMLYISHVDGLLFYASVSFVVSIILYSELRHLDIKVKPREPETPEEQKKNGLLKKGYMKFVYILTAAVFVRALFIIGASTFLPAYLGLTYVKHVVLDIILVAYMFPVVGQPLLGYVTSRKGGKFTVVLTYLLSTMFFGLFLLLPANLWISTIFLSLWAIFTFSGFPVLLGFVGQVVPKENIGMANSIVWGIGQTIGGAGGAGLVSLFALSATVPHSMLYVYLIGIVSLIFLPLLPSKSSVDRNNGATSA